MNNDTMPWERQPDESAKAFDAFTLYRDMSDSRSLRAVSQKCGKSCTLIARWSSAYHWVERAAAFDSYLQRQHLKKVKKQAADANTRHVQISMQLQKLSLEALNTMQPEDLSPRDIKEILRLAIDVERKALIENQPSAPAGLVPGIREQNPSDSSDTSAPLYPGIVIPDNGRDERPQNCLMPQAGPQTMFMSSSADIVIYGGAAGGGKTFALLLEALRHRDVPGFGGVIFRKNYTQITAEGGLWDASQKIFSQVPGAKSGKSPRFHWDFGGKSKLSFAYLEREEDLRSWQGTEIAYIGFDELTHFSKRQFLYMLSRNRSTCGITPYMRATCNPDADSWVAEFIDWWIDSDTGYPIQERSGQIRWMVNLNDVITWYPTREEGVQYGVQSGLSMTDAEALPKSVTFIASSLNDNKILMQINPGYMANLRALPMLDMERLLYGNWKIKAAAGLFFKRTQIGEMLTQIPLDVVKWVRAWDLAATSEDEGGEPAYTAGVLMGKRRSGRYVIADVINRRMAAADVRKTIKMTAASDIARLKRVRIRLPQDPGQAGKEQAKSYIKFLAGYDVRAIPETGSKEARAEPVAAQWQAGNFDIVIGNWNEEYFTQLENFPTSKFKDMVDATSSAFTELENTFDIGGLIT